MRERLILLRTLVVVLRGSLIVVRMLAVSSSSVVLRVSVTIGAPVLLSLGSVPLVRTALLLIRRSLLHELEALSILHGRLILPMLLKSHIP